MNCQTSMFVLRAVRRREMVRLLTWLKRIISMACLPIMENNRRLMKCSTYLLALKSKKQHRMQFLNKMKVRIARTRW